MNRRCHAAGLWALGPACLAAALAAQFVAGAGPEADPPGLVTPPPPAAGPSSAPTSGPSYASLLLPSAGDLPARMAEAVRRCAALLAAGGGSSPRAQERLLEIQRAVLATLGSYVDDEDLEVRLRVGEALDEMIVEARVTRMLASLPQDQRSPLLQFRRTQPALFSLMLSQDWGLRAKAVRRLTRHTDPLKLAEPLVVLCLRHHSTELVAEAAEAVARCEYRSDAIVEALAQALGRFQAEPDARYGRGNEASPVLPICDAMGSIGGPRAARALIDALPGNARGMGATSAFIAPLVDSLVATGERRAIPTLLPRLNADDRGGRFSWPYEAGGATTQATDYAFYAILRLASRSTSEYKLLVVDPNPFNEFSGARFNIGFAKDKDRKDAYEKLKGWWAAARDQPLYKGLEPLEPSPAKSGESRPRPASASQAAASAPVAASGPGAGPAGPALPGAAVIGEVASATRRFAEAFRSGSFPVRDAVRHELLQLYCASLQGIADQAEDRDSESGKRLLDALTESVTEAGIHSAGFQLPPDMRKKLSAFLAEQPKIARDAFNLNWSVRVEAADALAGLPDANALAEPIVLLYLKDPAPQISQAALKLAATGKYRSDAVVDALSDLIVAASEEEWSRVTYGGGPTDNSVQAGLTALTMIRSPRAAPMLMAMWMRRSSQNGSFPPALGDALVATGELGIMPHLLAKLRETNITMNTSTSKGKTLTCAPCDVPLLVLVRLAGQDPNDYQIMATNDYGTSRVGFKDDPTRKAALKKWNDWWGKARGSPPYKDLRPIPIPELTRPSAEEGDDSGD